MLSRILMGLCAFLFFASAPVLAAAPEAREFRDAVEAFAKGDPSPEDWLSDESPFAFALGKQFDETLTEEERTRMNTAVRHGQCEIVVSEQLRGFLRSYPELEIAVYSDSAFQSAFSMYLVPAHSFAYRRCQTWAEVIPVIQKSWRNAAMVDYARDLLTQVSTSQRHSFRFVEPDYAEHATDMLHLAFCQTDVDSLVDIAELSGLNEIHFLDLEEQYWLRFQLTKFGEETGELTAQIESSRASFNTLVDDGLDLHRLADRYLRKLEVIGEEVGPLDSIRRFCSAQ